MKTAHPNPSARKLLIVEDEALVALGVRLLLEDSGYHVTGAAVSAPEAIELAALARPELALVDVRLAHGTNGVMLAKALQGRFCIPSILVTAHLDYEEAAQARALGLLRKPFRDFELIQMIEAAFRWIDCGDLEDPMPKGMLLGHSGRT